MKIWRISQGVNNGYDTYDSAVVMSETEEGARRVHPDESVPEVPEGVGCHDNVWAKRGSVEVELIGETQDSKYAEGEVICATFNAG